MPKVKTTGAPKGEGKQGHKLKKRQQQEDDDATEEELAVPFPESPKVAKSPKSPKKPAGNQAKKADVKQKKKEEKRVSETEDDETEEEDHAPAKKAKKQKPGLEGGKGGKGAKNKKDEEEDESEEAAGKRGAEEAEGQPKKKKPKVKAGGKGEEEEYPTNKLPKVDYVQPYLVNLGGVQDEPFPKKGKNAKNGKPTPPPGAPGPVPSSWELYAKDKYDMVQEEYPSYKRGEVIAELKKRWNTVEDLEKEVYLDHQEEEVRRYKKEYMSFVKKNPTVYIHPPPKSEKEEMQKAKKEAKKSPKKPKADKVVKAKKEGKSKRPKTGYMYFIEDEVKRVKAENEDAKLNMGELMKTFGSKWETLPAKEKQAYQDKAKKAKDEWIASGGPEQAKEERKKKKEMVAVKGKAQVKVKYPQCLRSAYQFWIHKNKDSFNESYREQGIPKKEWPARMNDFWNKMEEDSREEEETACAAVKDAYASRMISLPGGPRVWMYEKRDNVWRQVDEGAGSKLTKALNEMKQFLKLRLNKKQATVDLQNMTFVFKKKSGDSAPENRRIMCCVVARGDAMQIPAPPKTPRAGKKGKKADAGSDGEESGEEEGVKKEPEEDSDENDED